MKPFNTRRALLWRAFSAATMIALTILTVTGCGEIAAVEPIEGASSLLVSWTAPTTNEDGSVLDDLAGYKLYYGTSSGSYSNVLDVGSYTNAEIGNLPPGTYYLAVTAYDMYGNESSFSEEVDHTLF
ncbi:MAG: fibronectin type III domain-containing protein [Pseudomonadota bacterium]|jgi:hypothetical protein